LGSKILKLRLLIGAHSKLPDELNFAFEVMQGIFKDKQLNYDIAMCAADVHTRTVAKKSSIGGFYVCAGGLTCENDKTPLIYSVSYFNLGSKSFV